ncbi:hypothetical protein HDU76_000621, partial [Blyttiomyces sp. JEL0837]
MRLFSVVLFSIITSTSYAALSPISKLSSSGEKVTGGPLVTGCFNVPVKVGGVEFSVQIDSGSSDLIIPGQNFPSYDPNGPMYPTKGKKPVTGLVQAGFADGSAWSGYFYKDVVSLASVSSTAVFAVMTNQTSNPPVTDGSTSQGLIGIAFDSLSSSPVDPKTVMTALVQAGQIQDLIAFRSCPATSLTDSFIDWGAEDL